MSENFWDKLNSSYDRWGDADLDISMAGENDTDK